MKKLTKKDYVVKIYGIILIFLMIIVAIMFEYAIMKKISPICKPIMTITIMLVIAVILIYFLIRYIKKFIKPFETKTDVYLLATLIQNNIQRTFLKKKIKQTLSIGRKEIKASWGKVTRIDITIELEDAKKMILPDLDKLEKYAEKILTEDKTLIIYVPKAGYLRIRNKRLLN